MITSITILDKHQTKQTRQIAIIVVSILRTPEDDK